MATSLREQSVGRDRIVAGITKAVTECGHAGLTLDQALRHSGASQAEFESHFESIEQGVIAAQDTFLERLWLEVAAACEFDQAWTVNLTEGLAAGLTYIRETSALARVFTVEAAASSLAVSDQQFAVLDRFAEFLREGRKYNPRAAELPEVTERVLIGGIASLVTGHLLSEDEAALEGLESELAELVLIFFVGRDEARRIVRG
jgi:hypothetical protein